MILRRGLAIVVVLGVITAGCSNGGETRARPGTRVLVALALDVDADGLAAAADAVAEPFGSNAGSFLTLADVRSRFGASDDTIDAALAVLRADGVDLAVDPTGSILWGKVEVSAAAEAFGVEVIESTDSSGTTVLEPDGTPRVRSGIDGVVGVVGLAGTRPTAVTTSTATTPAPSCPANTMTRQGLAEIYGLSDQVSAGLTGAGVTIAMLETETFDPQVFDLYNGCTDAGLTSADVATATVALTPDAAGGDEVALDAVAVSLLAPDASLTITRFDSNTSILFPLLDVLVDADQNGQTPDILVSTVGFCEDELTPTEADAAEFLLAALAASGTTAVAATGDAGSSACHPQSDDPAVQYPASSAWVSASGGVTYSGIDAAPSELTVWNDTPARSFGGGGGTSQLVDRPSWQTDTAAAGSKRVLPDFSAYAEPGGVGQVPSCTAEACEWKSLGGTSMGVTVLGSTAALFAELRGTAETPRRFGHLGRALTTAATDESGIFTDVTDGNNEVFTSACCAASRGFDLASGWGLVNFGRLAEILE